MFQTFPLFNGFRRGADRSSGVSPDDFPHSEVYARVTGSLHSRLFTPASIVTERKKTDGEATASGEHRLQVLLEVKTNCQMHKHETGQVTNTSTEHSVHLKYAAARISKIPELYMLMLTYAWLYLQVFFPPKT